MSNNLRQTTIGIDWKINNDSLVYANNETDKIISKAGKAEQSFKGTDASINKSATSLRDHNTNFQKNTNSAKEFSDKASSAFNKTESSAKDVSSSIGKIETETDKAKTSATRYGSEVNSSFGKAENAAADLKVDINKVETETDSAKVSVSQYGTQADASFGKAEQAAKEVATSMDKVENETDSAKSASKKFGDGFKTSMKEAGSSTGFLEDKVDKLSSKVSGAYSTIRNAAITLAAISGIKFAFNASSDYNESLNKVNVAFGDNSEEVEKWSKSTLKNSGLAQGTALDLAATFGDMSTSMGLSTDEASDMSTSMVGLAGDLASFKNIGVDQAYSALNGVFTGETESLKGLGIVMTQTNLEQFAMSQGMLKSSTDNVQAQKNALAREKAQVSLNKAIKDHGKNSLEARDAQLKLTEAQGKSDETSQANLSTLSQAELVQLRYAYVMDKTKNAQGDFAATSDQAANSTRVFSESAKEFAANAGQVLLPLFTPVIQMGSKMMISLNKYVPGIKKAFDPLKPYVESGIDWFETQFDKIPEYLESASNFIEPALEPGKKAFISAKDFITDSFIPTIGSLVDTMGPGFLDGAKIAFEGIVLIIDGVVKPAFDWIKDYSDEHPGRMEKFATAATVGLLSLMAYKKVAGVFDGVAGSISGVITLIGKIPTGSGPVIAEGAGDLAGTVGTGKLSKVKTAGGGLVKGVKSGASYLKNGGLSTIGNWLFRGGGAATTAAAGSTGVGVLTAGSVAANGTAVGLKGLLSGGAKSAGGLLKSSGKAIPGLSAILAAANLIGINDENKGNKIGGSTGMLAGGAAGAAIGSFAGPLGTIVGGMIGTMAGTKFGTSAGEAIQKNWGTWTGKMQDFSDDHPILGAPYKWAADFVDSVKDAADSTKKFFTDAYESAKAVFADPLKVNLETEFIEDGVSKKTAKKVNDYLENDLALESGRKEQNASGSKISEEDHESTLSARDEQTAVIVSALDKKEQASGKNINVLKDAGVIDNSAAESAINSADEMNRIRVKNAEKTNDELKALEQARYDEQLAATKGYEDRINGIKQTAKDEGKALTQEQLDEISRLELLSAEERKSIYERYEPEMTRVQNEQRENAVNALSASAEEQKIIMGRLADDSSTLSAKQASEIVKNSLSAKEGAIKSANEKYDEVIAAAEEEYYVSGTISKEQFEAIKGNAENQRDSAIELAEEMHNGVVEQAKAQASGQLDQIDWATGDSLSKWQQFVVDVAGVWNTITGGINSVLKALGVDSQIGKWTPKGYTSSSSSASSSSRKTSGSLEMNYAGNSNFSGGHALVGEEGFELAYNKSTSKAQILGANGPEVANIASGSKILNHKDSAKILSGGLGNGQVLPGFDKGTSSIGDFVSNAWSGTKEVASNVVSKAKDIGSKVADTASAAWDWVSDPAGKLKELIAEKNPYDMGSDNAIIKAGAGAVQTLGEGAKEWVTEKVSGLFNFEGVGSTEQVNAWVQQAMSIAGVPTSWAGPLATIAMKESGGNPSAQNNWDINAINGIPSKGLMQTIVPTFEANKEAGHNNILNPVDNILAAINYIQGRYGDISRVPGIKAMASGRAYVGYEKGGRPPLKETVLVGENGPELVEMDQPGVVHPYEKTKQLFNNNNQQTSTSQSVEFKPQINVTVTGGDTNVAAQVAEAVESKMNDMFESFRRQFGPGVVY